MGIASPLVLEFVQIWLSLHWDSSITMLSLSKNKRIFDSKAFADNFQLKLEQDTI